MPSTLPTPTKVPTFPIPTVPPQSHRHVLPCLVPHSTAAAAWCHLHPTLDLLVQEARKHLKHIPQVWGFHPEGKINNHLIHKTRQLSKTHDPLRVEAIVLACGDLPDSQTERLSRPVGEQTFGTRD